MKLNYKILALLLALIVAFSAFVGCTPDENTDETTAAVIDGTEAPETEPIPEGPTLYTLISGGESHVRIVRPADADADSKPVKTAIELRKTINNVTSVSPELGDDWIKDGATHDSSALEILVGATNYTETAEVTKDLTYGEYIIKAVGNKIVIFSYTDSGYTKAVCSSAILAIALEKLSLFFKIL